MLKCNHPKDDAHQHSYKTVLENALHTVQGLSARHDRRERQNMLEVWYVLLFWRCVYPLVSISTKGSNDRLRLIMACPTKIIEQSQTIEGSVDGVED